MKRATFFLAGLLLALFCNFSTRAQNAPPPTPGRAELSIIIGARQLKFTPLRPYQELRLEVFNSTAELIYDSGALTEAALDWNLHDSNGNPLAPGLYAYTLSLKVPEAEVPRQHQGHFILEQGNDQLWLTTRDEGGVGAEVIGGALTIARSPAGATAGAGYLASGRTLGERAGLQRAAPGRTVTEKKAGVTREGEQTPLHISGSGTTGRLTKWLNGPGEVVGDSIIHETAAGDLGIGTTTPGGVLDVLRSSPNPLIGRFWNTGAGPAQLRFVGGTGATSQFLITDTAEWLTSIAVNNSVGMQFRVRGIGTPNNEAQLNASARLAILRNGNVGVGTTTPANKLTVDIGAGAGPVDSGITIQGYPSTFGDLGLRINNTGAGGREWYIDSTNIGSGYGGGKLAFVNGIASLPTMVLTNEGRVGIGNHNPFYYRLHVEGGGDNSGIYGSSTALGANGVVGEAHNGSDAFGIWGLSNSGYAGFFSGAVHVNGNLSKSSGSFKIDHPLDPENKYLYHSFVESPDIWFGALNDKFRYQLTALEAPGPNLHIAQKIADNRFRIAGGLPGLEVSWQVTGVRKDAYANKHRVPVEEDKPEAERGAYLHPAVFNQPEEKGVEWKYRPAMMQQMKEAREKAAREQNGKAATPPNDR